MRTLKSLKNKSENFYFFFCSNSEWVVPQVAGVSVHNYFYLTINMWQQKSDAESMFKIYFNIRHMVKKITIHKFLNTNSDENSYVFTARCWCFFTFYFYTNVFINLQNHSVGKINYSFATNRV